MYNLEHPREDAVAGEAVQEHDGEPAAAVSSLFFLLRRCRLGGGRRQLVVLGSPDAHHRAGVIDGDGAAPEPCHLGQAVHELVLGYLYPVHHPGQPSRSGPLLCDHSLI